MSMGGGGGGGVGSGDGAGGVGGGEADEASASSSQAANQLSPVDNAFVGGLGASLADQQKAILGEELHTLIAKRHPDLAAKITGMMMDMDTPELLVLLGSEEQLKAKVHDALVVLQEDALDAAEKALLLRFLQTQNIRLLVLMGYPGAGKTLLARSFAERGWKMVSITGKVKDDQACITKVQELLSETGHCHKVIVDRPNLTTADRRVWTDVGRQCGIGSNEIALAHLDRDSYFCLQQIRARKNTNSRDRTPPPSGGPKWSDMEARQILKEYEAQLEPPEPQQEGFDGGLHTITTQGELSWFKDIFGVSNKIAGLREKAPQYFDHVVRSATQQQSPAAEGPAAAAAALSAAEEN
ncbi:unnamed protein product [Vitrella brassicaformis CCMP3155]|uniref:PABC domain-containing protein n=1 Tax=Vitrella brassicaformis (strain CCMP3155) TaxID=1169540 RepID=A0A0G4H7Q2_VITBC|nr:unnamed protein product [Vitrella brassicaformis CCMP3155]|eukprot:CEM39904.1 unnamed protein product [Vitrella brassicaformis CCMP3155]